MKILKGSYSGTEPDAIEVSVANAIKESIEGASRMTEGRLECLADEVNKQTEIIAKLTEILVRHNLMKPEELSEIVGFQFAVED